MTEEGRYIASNYGTCSRRDCLCNLSGHIDVRPNCPNWLPIIVGSLDELLEHLKKETGQGGPKHAGKPRHDT